MQRSHSQRTSSTSAIAYEAFRTPRRGRGVVSLGYQSSGAAVLLFESLCQPRAFEHLLAPIPNA